MLAENFFDMNGSFSEKLFLSCEYPWEVLDVISEYIERIARTLCREHYYSPSRGIWIAKSAEVSDSASLKAPVIIGEGCE